MIVISMLFDFVMGYALHGLRPWTMQFQERLSDLIRYTIGLFGFIMIAPVNVLLMIRRNKKDYEGIFIGLAITALAYGAGVVVGYIFDK